MELLDISTVKSKNLPIVFVEDIPEEALIPNLVQLYQKTGAVKSFVEDIPVNLENLSDKSGFVRENHVWAPLSLY